ncbi:hypothetical protein EDB83DRAFT_2399343, partial [Lactarius deliciosus]
MRLTYGYDLKDNDDMLVPPRRVVDIMKQVHFTRSSISKSFPISCVRHLPSWVPWFKYEPLASECRELARRTKDEPFDFVRNSMREGTAVPSLATEYLQEADLLSDLDSQPRTQDLKDLLGSLFIGNSSASSTNTCSTYTNAAMSSLFLALILYPESLTLVTSRDRLPTYDDKPRLPYIEAMSKELVRWQMVTATG